MLSALIWGSVAASSLVIGAVAALSVGGLNGFAAGALLVMLVGSMIPRQSEKAKDQAGLAAVLGFAVAAGLSLAS